MNWYLGPIETKLDDIKDLFLKTKGHKHEKNYLKEPLFEYTKFARIGYDPHCIYYSAGIERPEYNGSIRIMSRHTRDRSYNFGSRADDLFRGLETLELSTEYALLQGYTNIWLSREESPNLFEYFAKRSKYDWSINYEQIPGKTMYQYIMRLE
jgi:hypothetical protein